MLYGFKDIVSLQLNGFIEKDKEFQEKLSKEIKGRNWFVAYEKGLDIMKLGKEQDIMTNVVYSESLDETKNDAKIIGSIIFTVKLKPELFEGIDMIMDHPEMEMFEKIKIKKIRIIYDMNMKKIIQI